MFKISSINQTYFTPVTVEIPDGTGKATKHTFDAEFRRLSQNDLDDLYRRIEENKKHVAKAIEDGESDPKPLFTDDELIHEVMVGWRGVADEHGQPLEFNEENLEKLLDIYPVRTVTATAFFSSTKTSKRKN